MKPTIPRNRKLRVGLVQCDNLTNEKLRALQDVLPDFEEWSDDLVAFMVWERCRQVAMSDEEGGADLIHSLHAAADAMMSDTKQAAYVRGLEAGGGN